jgi:hypothetical protein
MNTKQQQAINKLRLEVITLKEQNKVLLEEIERTKDVWRQNAYERIDLKMRIDAIKEVLETKFS